MSDIDTEKKLQQFEEFFSIDAFFNTNITPLNSEDKLSFDAFLDTF
jgi:hypothetical protein